MKKLLILIICFQISLMPFLCINEFSFAESGSGGSGGDAWIAVNDEESMVAAFKAYCRTRNFNKTFNFSNGTPSNLAKLIITYDYNELEKLCVLAGTDIDTVNAGMWYKIDQNNILKFFYSTSSMSLLNELYSALLTEHGIQENDNKEIYSNEWFEDLDNNGCFVFIGFPSGTGRTGDFTNKKIGSLYRTDTYVPTINAQLNNGETTTRIFNFTSNLQNIQYTITKVNSDNIYVDNSNGHIFYNYGNYYDCDNGGCAIYKISSNYYFGTFSNYYYKGDKTQEGIWYCNNIRQITDGNIKPVKINASQGDFNTPPENKSMEVETDSDTINNYITNNNSNVTNNYYDDDEPPSPPPYTNPFDNNPTGGTIGGDGSINFQMPDLNIDWNLGLNVEDLPFPFSIPFDFNNALKMLDVEPETPRFQGTIHIPYINYNWQIDLDFGEYDEYETLINMFQKVFLFGYVISLILATRAVMHIY